ncbi:protein of unknown function [Candidatus Methylocalor cossyra]|uniref:Uncharacterized protein n=1 Tax=Candidatus Methylocalor cossyra TaxID=3108543 RepID=A0ABM9NF73_9GAMM
MEPPVPCDVPRSFRNVPVSYRNLLFRTRGFATVSASVQPVEWLSLNLVGLVLDIRTIAYTATGRGRASGGWIIPVVGKVLRFPHPYIYIRSSTDLSIAAHEFQYNIRTTGRAFGPIVRLQWSKQEPGLQGYRLSVELADGHFALDLGMRLDSDRDRKNSVIVTTVEEGRSWRWWYHWTTNW